MSKPLVNTLTCTRCEHTWVPRKPEVFQCPNCKSPKWNQPKEKK